MQMCVFSITVRCRWWEVAMCVWAPWRMWASVVSLSPRGADLMCLLSQSGSISLWQTPYCISLNTRPTRSLQNIASVALQRWLMPVLKGSQGPPLPPLPPCGARGVWPDTLSAQQILFATFAVVSCGVCVCFCACVWGCAGKCKGPLVARRGFRVYL